jgi:hypothetical protein
MKRRLVWLTLAMFLVVMAGLVVFLAVTRDPINETNFNKIQVGMTKKEVVAILGREAEPELIWRAHVWYGNKHTILVRIDEQDLVASKDIRERGGADESLIDKFRRWLRLD